MKNNAVYTLILIVLTTCLAGCGKNHTELLLTGSISGKLSPAGAAASVAAVSEAGNVTANKNPDSSGHFSISGLQAGLYKIGFATDTAFITPDSVWVKVVAGQDFNMGTVTAIAKNYNSLGGISGRISPAKAAAGIAATEISGSLRYTAIPDTAGNFRIGSMRPGIYTISSTAAPGFRAPDPVTTLVTAGQNMIINGLVYKQIGYNANAIDTFAVDITLNSAQSVNDFVSRAGADSAIVFTGALSVSVQQISPELAGAFDKIMAVKSFMITGAATTSLSFRFLTNAGTFTIGNAPNLTTVDLGALTTVGTGGTTGMVSLNGCPALANLNISALHQFAGSLALVNTGFKDLAVFNKTLFRPFALNITGNKKLTTVRGLNFTGDSITNLTINANPLLTTLDGLQDIKRLTNETVITGNPLLQTLTGLDHVVFARHFTLTANPQLSAVCAARQVVNLLKDVPDYAVIQMNQLGNWVSVTKQALTAFGNGVYTTRSDLLAAIAKCP